MNIVRCAVVAIVLFLSVFCSFALSKENWAVVSYIEVNDSIQNQVFKEMSGKNKDNAIGIATDVCVTYGEGRKASSKCKLIGTCSQVGWFAIASMVKSSGHVGIGCGKDSEEEAIEAAKKACGSPECAKIFTHKIKKQEKRNNPGKQP